MEVEIASMAVKHVMDDAITFSRSAIPWFVFVAAAVGQGSGLDKPY